MYPNGKSFAIQQELEEEEARARLAEPTGVRATGSGWRRAMG